MFCLDESKMSTQKTYGSSEIAPVQKYGLVGIWTRGLLHAKEAIFRADLQAQCVVIGRTEINLANKTINQDSFIHWFSSSYNFTFTIILQSVLLFSDSL